MPPDWKGDHFYEQKKHPPLFIGGGFNVSGRKVILPEQWCNATVQFSYQAFACDLEVRFIFFDAYKLSPGANTRGTA